MMINTPIPLITPFHRSLPTMFGMGVYAFEGIGLVVPSETAIRLAHKYSVSSWLLTTCFYRRPEKFRTVLVICLIIASFQYIAFGSLTYIGFGNDTEQQGRRYMLI